MRRAAAAVWDGFDVARAEYAKRVGISQNYLSTMEYEQACQQRGLHLFVLPPRSPKLNGAVEPANRIHTEEFYQVTPCSLEMKKLDRELRQWERSTTPWLLISRSATSLPASSCPELIPPKGMKSATNLLDEYHLLTETVPQRTILATTLESSRFTRP